MQAHRYAIYLAPAEPYRTFGSRWLGRCADTGAALVEPAIDGARHAAWIQSPAHYGLHATLKAPFRLATGANAAALDATLRDFARRQTPFAAPLALRSLRGFVAWVLADDVEGRHRMHALADAAVREFDAFRAPATEAERARRRPGELGDAQRRMLDEWGYPYAFDTFVFHITLTGMLAADDERAAIAGLRALGNGLLATPLPVQSVSLFVQPEPGADFLVARHYGFDGGTADGAGAAYLGEAQCR